MTGICRTELVPERVKVLTPDVKAPDTSAEPVESPTLSAKVIETAVVASTRRADGAGAVRPTVGVPPTSGTTFRDTTRGEEAFPSGSVAETDNGSVAGEETEGATNEK